MKKVAHFTRQTTFNAMHKLTKSQTLGIVNYKYKKALHFCKAFIN